MIEERFESIQSQQRMNPDEASTTLVLSQKIEYLQNEIQSISEAKHCQEVECQNLHQQLIEKDHLLISKNEKIQNFYNEMDNSEAEFQGHIKELVQENNQLKNN